MKSAKNSTSTTSTNSASSMPMEMMPSLTSMPLWSLTSKPRSTLILFPHSLLLFLLVFFVFVCLIQLGTQNRKGKKKKRQTMCSEESLACILTVAELNTTKYQLQNRALLSFVLHSTTTQWRKKKRENNNSRRQAPSPAELRSTSITLRLYSRRIQ